MCTTLMNCLLLICLCLTLFSCSEKTQRTDRLFTVDIESGFSKEQGMNISEVADTVEYLELKTPEDLIISRIWDVVQAEDCWLVRSISGISKFTLDGEWIMQIGKKGQGPGEYISLHGFDYDPIHKEVLIADWHQILFYDLNGNYLRNIKIEDEFFYNIAVSDTVFWTTALGIHQEKYLAHAFNRNNDTLSVCLNPNYGIKIKNTDGVYFSHSRWEREFYHYNGNLYLKNRISNDTVFRLDGVKKTPYIAFDMGKYKLPLEYEYWYSAEDNDRYGGNYWGIVSVAEDDRYVFFLAKRRGKHDFDDDDKRYLVYDKTTKTEFTVKGNHGKMLKDDLLGGSAIWPRFITQDFYIWTCEWTELSEDVKKGLYPSLSPVLAKQFEYFNYGTNELIILCRKKKQ